MPWHKGSREDTGYSPSLGPIGPQDYPTVPSGSEDNKNKEMTPDTSTGRYWLPSPTRRQSHNARMPSESPLLTANYHAHQQRQTMYGRKTPELKEPSLNTEHDHSRETHQQTGMNSGDTLLMGTSWKSRPTYEYVITQLSDESARTLRNQLQWSELATYSGAKLAQESLEQLGQPAVWTLTLRIQTRNSGVDIMVTKH